MKFHSGLVTTKDFHEVINSPIYNKLKNENASFLKNNFSHLMSFGRKWTEDSLHQWSRVWEYPYVFSAVAEKVKNNPSVKVLDAGCGLTFFPFQVKTDFPQIEMHGTDYDIALKDIYTQFNDRLNSKVIFKQGDLRTLDYPEGSFDIIYCLSVLEHTENYKQIADHFFRLLKPGGRFILTMDISLDGERRLSIDDADGLIDYLNTKFKAIQPTEKVSATLKNRSDILSTGYAAKIDRKLLPWTSWKIAIRRMMAGQKPKLMYDLACFCQVYEKPSN